MFSNKENVNILTALLTAHGIRHAVVCPGSRNAPIVHNLNECESIRCVPATDERSAGFIAIGMAQATGEPVVVCVTSGTALLNLAPAVAEAYYQHLPLIVISADRPAAWIDQLDGQTLPQPGALGRFVRKCVNMPEPTNDTERWHCNRLVNEAIAMATYRNGAPVHINVPITEPLFDFSTDKLPAERTFTIRQADCSKDYLNVMTEVLATATKPMVVLGQMKPGAIDNGIIRNLSRHAVVLHEALCGNQGAVHFDEVLYALGNDATLKPDLIIYAGDTVVSKRLRHFMRKAMAPTYIITADASEIHDPTMNLRGIIECNNEAEMKRAFRALANAFESMAEQQHIDNGQEEFREMWHKAISAAEDNAAEYEPKFSQIAVVKYLEEQLEDFPVECHVHYANSSAVRLANIYASHYVWCNRGVNGIEGSLSTAAGFSIATDDNVICVIGDLSFFYDQNALWNQSLRGNFRIILLNNHCGGIFHLLHGLEKSDARDTMVAAGHNTEAQGICTQNDIGYMKATNMTEMQIGMVTLLTRESNRPMLLEVFTDAEDDKKALQDYYRRFRQLTIKGTNEITTHTNNM